jgi:hypothetical protein
MELHVLANTEFTALDAGLLLGHQLLKPRNRLGTRAPGRSRRGRPLEESAHRQQVEEVLFVASRERLQ